VADFNANINEPGMQHILQNGFSLAKSAYVDFILYSTRHFRVTSSGVGDSAGSDHAPVYAELDFL
jgi:endonuclease/exonuclease/phosphatase (EEP) superfamily protein YafD